MNTRNFRVRLAIASVLSLCAMGPWPPTMAAEPKWDFRIIAEKKLEELPAGPLYWRIENFPTPAEAQAVASPSSLAAEMSGKVWLFTLGAKGAASRGGTGIAEIGPVPPIAAPEYQLRILQIGGPPGAKTPVHTHPGSEAFYVLTGRLSQRTQHGLDHVDAGRAMPGHAPGTAMEVSSSGTDDLSAFALFVVDAGKPFFSPAKFE